jgi:hypothetical protein
MRRTLSSMTQEELEFIELVSAATHVAAWRLLGCILEGTYGVLSADEERRIEQWLETHFADRRARRVFDRIMTEPGMQLGHARKKGKA